MGDKVSVNVYEKNGVETDEPQETPLTASVVEINPPIAGQDGLHDWLLASSESYRGESLSSTTRTSTNWYEKLSIPFIATASTYTISVFFQFDYSDNKGIGVRIQLDNSDLITWDLAKNKNDGWDSRQIVMSKVLTAGASTLDIDFKSLQSGKSVKLKEVRAIISRVVDA